MKADDLIMLPRRPDSEFEWEDLLLRIELMPRALNVELENAGGRCPPGMLADLVDRESLVHHHLERAASGASSDGTGDLPIIGEAPQVGMSIADCVDRFVRLRNRNFAMLQRRGINVWDWTVEVEPSVPATVFQLLSLLVRRDVEFLGRLRNERSTASPAC